jgi:glycosyltransferase involved in cell wall biosynthesis
VRGCGGYGARIDPFVKRELDTLIAENQELHTRLGRLGEVGFLLGRLARAAARPVRQRLRRSQGSAPRVEGREDFATSFRPYEVRRTSPAAGSRPRVVHAVANFYTGGSARLVVDLVERLGDRYDHAAVVRDNPPQPHYVGLDLLEVPKLGVKEAMRLMQRLRPDLLHVHFLGHHRNQYSEADWSWYHELFDAAEKSGCPVIENVNIPVAPYLSSAVRTYVFVSDYVREVFGRDGEHNVTVYPGSDFQLFAQSPADDSSEPCIGMVYRLEKDKLDERAIDVFIDVVRRRPGTRALIVGGGRFLDAYRKRVAEAELDGRFEFTAFVAYEDLPRLYRRMSVFVAPPHSESFGHVVPLAMNMGIPVAAYAVGALPEILGTDDLLAPSGDAPALATKVVELLDDPARRARVGAANRERAQRLFSLEGMVSSYRELYDEVLGSRS